MTSGKIKFGAQKLWQALTWVAGGYAVYQHLKTLNHAKDDLFNELTPEQQATWIKVFGRPGAQSVPIQPAPLLQTQVNLPKPGGTIDQLKAGT
jgi:hypothetical protein